MHRLRQGPGRPGLALPHRRAVLARRPGRAHAAPGRAQPRGGRGLAAGRARPGPAHELAIRGRQAHPPAHRAPAPDGGPARLLPPVRGVDRTAGGGRGGRVRPGLASDRRPSPEHRRRIRRLIPSSIRRGIPLPNPPLIRLDACATGREAVSVADVEARPEGGVHQAGLAELYVRHQPAALRLAYMLTGHRELAEDLVQDAFVKLAGRFVHLRKAEAFETYLKRMIVNLFLSHLRRRKVERAYVQREGGEPGTAQGPSDLGERDEMWRALAGLPERQRAALVLRY